MAANKEKTISLTRASAETSLKYQNFMSKYRQIKSRFERTFISDYSERLVYFIENIKILVENFRNLEFFQNVLEFLDFLA